MAMAKRRAATGRDDLDHRYLDALVRGDAAMAHAVVEQARARGWTTEQVYLHLFVPAQVEIGARWRARTLTAADEHLATEITLGQMDRLRDGFAARGGAAGRVVVACVDGETHAIGARMLADFLMLHGFAIDYVGASVPADDLVRFVTRRRPDLVALSVTQAEHLPALRETAAALKRLASPPAILAGGAALPGSRGAAALGVDAIAADARAGVREARALLGARAAPADRGADYFERLGRRIQELRAARDWTQQDLAEKAELDRTYVSGLERGRQNPSLGVLLRLTRALEVPLERLVVLD
jgi:methanogenic corrinoid protein MtbC1/DNA-binding XRE family transcriptional regulator